MHYQMVFNVTQTDFSHWSALWFALAVAVFSGVAFWSVWRRQRHPGFRSMVSLFFVVIFLLAANGIASLLFGLTWDNYQQLKTAMKESRCKIVEGTVSNLRQGSFWGSRGEKGFGEIFVVNGVEFRCRSEGGMQNGFRKAGVIREGMRVRIHYCGDMDKDIACLEIAP